jgi:hypothetical protein
MSKTPFSSKVKILGSFWFYFRDRHDNDEGWQSFYASNDLSLPIAYASSKDFVSFTDKGRDLIEQAWKDLCYTIDLDADENYESMQNMIDLANQ